MNTWFISSSKLCIAQDSFLQNDAGGTVEVVYNVYYKCTYPKYVVHKESSQENAAGCYCVQVKQLNSIERECQAKYVVGNPVLEGSKKKTSSSLSPKVSFICTCLVTCTCDLLLFSGQNTLLWKCLQVSPPR